MSVSEHRWAGLADRLSGRLVRPTDAGYDLARQLQIAEFDRVRPAAVAYCRTVDDVRACLAVADGTGVHLAIRSGGHNFAGWSTTDGLVVDLSRMDGVAFADGLVRLGPGAQAVDVLDRLGPHGPQIATGVCPTVCPAGFVTGGGLGFQTRRFGTAADRLVSARVVLADGSVVDCSTEREADLFWALRGGGGGNFGVVVELAVRPTHVPRMTLFTAVWGWDAALDVLDAWQHWADAAPDELSTEIGAVLPDAADGAVPTVMMHGAYLGERAGYQRALAELCAASGADPVHSTADELPYDRAMLRLYQCEGTSPQQRRRVGTTPEAMLPRQGFLRERHRTFAAPMDRAVVQDALRVFDTPRRAGQFRYLAFAALGGAANAVGRTETAYVHRDARLLAKFTLIGANEQPDEPELAAAQDWVDRGFAVLDPPSTGHSYVNYPDPALADWKWAYYGENYARLAEVKKAYDPAGRFSFAQSIRA
ncbi:FAD-binding oxidoreductase [Micromonospora wenchangensis]|uniref:FAD-binding oxidoreductase n=1 Tax=Micromonospora wenchangensis TaxID=1185415 RepID=UPI003D71117F